MSVYYPANLNFISKYELDEKNDFEKLIISCYYVLTTLSTVGYGDFVSVNNSERMLAIFIMLLGVAIFSYVMGSFTDLITSYDKKIGKSDKVTDLHNWLASLSKYSKNNKFKSQLVKKIDHHFNYFWEHDRNALINKEDPYLKFLPKNLKLKVIEFLWGDVFTNFSTFFLYYSNNKEKFFKFYYNIAFSIMPRRFFSREYIYKPEEEIEELYLISDGFVEIGFSYLNENKKDIKFCKIIKSNDWIGEFYNLFNVKSKYYYRAGTEVKCYGISKMDFVHALEKHAELFAIFKTKAYRRYYDYIKVVLEKNIANEKEEEFKPILNELGDKKIKNFIKSRIEIKNQVIKNIIYEVERKFVKLDDDYANISKHLFDLSYQCDSDLVTMNLELEETQQNLNKYLKNA